MSQSGAVMDALRAAFTDTDSYQCAQYPVYYEVLAPGYFCRLWYVGETRLEIGSRTLTGGYWRVILSTVVPCSTLEAVPLLYEFYKGLAT